MKTNWYRVHAKSMLKNCKGEDVGFSQERIIAKFYIPSDADNYKSLIAVQCPSWVTRISEGQ